TGNVSAANGVTLSPGTNVAAGAIAITGDLTMNAGSTLTAKLTGPNTTTPTAGTDFDQVSVSGTVTLNNPTLSAVRTTSYVPDNGVAFKVINNSGGAAIAGAFNGLPDGSTVTLNPSNGGVFFGVRYQVGGGHDAVLTTLAPTTVYVDDTWSGTAVGSDPAS